MPISKKASLQIDTTLPKFFPKTTTTTTITNNNKPTNPPSPLSSPSEDEIYSVAQIAHTKLVIEGSLKDQNLRRLVGHANLYDKLLDQYNNCCSSSDSDSESESESDTDVEEIEDFASHAFATPQGHGLKSKRKTNSSPETVIHEDAMYVYHDQHPAGGEFGDVLVLDEESVDEAVLCKVSSHADSGLGVGVGLNLNMQGFGGRYAEVEVKELGLDGDFDE
ncbi:uncharacterized protein RSE6_14683 [Rhynchosporium secalis]|uniref:Uncharacterized protein n=1 Tax=Rhynchosporium secalis TaxID=38038 RepID=A0A1E1MVW4_RHYSE|nr:uncharacterized protein RSE6_14683 [Rhynchosporium secalis]